jgi:hypothetical protein
MKFEGMHGFNASMNVNNKKEKQKIRHQSIRRIVFRNAAQARRAT